MPTRPVATIEAYLASLSEEQREVVNAVRAIVNEHRDPLLEEGMIYGMPGWSVPKAIYPPGYHVDGLPLAYGSIAARKGGYSLYLMGLYDGPGNSPDGPVALARWFRTAWEATGLRLDIGKSCVRFRRVDGLAGDVLAEYLRRLTVERFVANYEAARAGAKGR